MGGVGPAEQRHRSCGERLQAHDGAQGPGTPRADEAVQTQYPPGSDLEVDVTQAVRCQPCELEDGGNRRVDRYRWFHRVSWGRRHDARAAVSSTDDGVDQTLPRRVL